MVLRKYQPERTDFLINTDWGLPPEDFSSDQARETNMLLFHGRWVTPAQIRQLRHEYLAYRSIRILGTLLMVLAPLVIINMGEITKGGDIATFFTIFYAMIMLICGFGLFRFARLAQRLAVLFFLSLFILPFLPPLADDKGAPFLIAYGAIGLYYVLRKSSRKIFSPLAADNNTASKPASSYLRKIIYALLLTAAALAIYAAYDISQANTMAADACNKAEKGTSLSAFLTALTENDYKTISRPDMVMLVPKRGLGRNHCTVLHDGTTITGSQTGFTD